jgi:predicted transcriptional regulator
LIDTNKLKGLIVERGYSQSDIAKMLGITPKTFYERMNRGIFYSNEIEKMIDILSIPDPVTIFFADTVTH